jgi:hypothetical protein
MTKVSKRVNTTSHLYTADEASLERALSKIREFERIHHRLPKSGDPGLGGIVAAVKKGIWKKFSLTTWNHLLHRACGQINVEREIYARDLKGLEKAKEKLRAFHTSQNRYPKSTDEGMGTIVGAIHRRTWIKFGIQRWKDLYIETFGFNPKELYQNPYEGEEGLKRAQQELREFKAQHTRLPKYSDKELNPIRHMATSGRWSSWGINRWNDLIRLTFNEVTYNHGKYKEKQGLERAIQEIQAFQKKQGRLPKTRDTGMKSMQKAIQRGYWIDYGVKTWLQLLDLA